MDPLSIVFASVGLALGGGIGAGLLRVAIGHAKKHQEIDMRLNSGDKQFVSGTSWFEHHEDDHRRIERKINALSGGVKELLVHSGLRTPGQGLNGEKEKSDG